MSDTPDCPNCCPNCAAADSLKRTNTQLEGEIERLTRLINTPLFEEFTEAVVREAAHQRERWGKEHDAEKQPSDWYWTLGYLAGKALRAHSECDFEKALHHTISSAALLCQWHGRVRVDRAVAHPEVVTEEAPNGD